MTFIKRLFTTYEDGPLFLFGPLAVLADFSDYLEDHFGLRGKWFWLSVLALSFALAFGASYTFFAEYIILQRNVFLAALGTSLLVHFALLLWFIWSIFSEGIEYEA